MGTNLRKLCEEDTEILTRQLAVFVVFKYVALLGFLIFAMFKGALNIVSIGLALWFGYKLVKALQYSAKVRNQVTQGRPLKMKVYFSKQSWGPFSDLQATLYDPRPFDPFGQLFKPKWMLLGSNWNPEKFIGDAQECLVYADRDSGDVCAFTLPGGPLFAKPSVVPWRKVDVAELIRTGEASNVEPSELLEGTI